MITVLVSRLPWDDRCALSAVVSGVWNGLFWEGQSPHMMRVWPWCQALGVGLLVVPESAWRECERE